MGLPVQDSYKRGKRGGRHAVVGLFRSSRGLSQVRFRRGNPRGQTEGKGDRERRRTIALAGSRSQGPSSGGREGDGNIQGD